MSNLIDRQMAIDALQKEINKGIPPFDDVVGSIRCGVRLARNIIEDLPTVQPETATITIGRTKGGVAMWYECGTCGEPIDQKDCYCGNCGRKLKNEEVSK